MQRIPIAIVRVMTLSDQANESFNSMLEGFFPYLSVHSYVIPDQPEGVHDHFSFHKAEPKIIELVQSLSASPFRGFFVNCAEDPGVLLARKKIPQPVWGAGSASALVAKSTGLPTASIGLTDEAPPIIADLLGSQLVASARPPGVETALDLERSQHEILTAAEYCVSKGARCLILACTGMSLLGTASYLNSVLKIPVIDPLMAPLSLIQQLLTGLPGISH